MLDEKTIKEIKTYLKKLDDMEANNEWLPSPHEIETFIDMVQNAMGRGTLEDRQYEVLLMLEDRLCEHYQGAYEQ